MMERTLGLSSASLDDLWRGLEGDLLLLLTTLASVVGGTASDSSGGGVKSWLCARWDISSEGGEVLGGDGGDEGGDDERVLHICGLGFVSLVLGLIDKYCVRWMKEEEGMRAAGSFMDGEDEEARRSQNTGLLRNAGGWSVAERSNAGLPRER